MPDTKSTIDRALEDQELMRSWGELNALWDTIEQWLYRAFDALIEDDPDATRAVFFSQKAHAARRDMLAELAKYVLRNRPQELDKLEGALNRVRARAEDRNKLAHAEWGELFDADTQTYQFIRLPVKARMHEEIKDAYSKARLKEVVVSMRDTIDSLALAIRHLRAEKFERRVAEWKRTADPKEVAAFDSLAERLSKSEATSNDK